MIIGILMAAMLISFDVAAQLIARKYNATIPD